MSHLGRPKVSSKMKSKCILLFYFLLITLISGYYTVSPDCPTMMNFLRGLNVHITEPQLFDSVPEGCCNYLSGNGFGYFRISCTQIGATWYATSLEIEKINLTGEIKSQYLPSTMRSIYIQSTTLNCEIPSDLPNGIQTLQMAFNRLKGKIPDTLPSQLIQLDLSFNLLSGAPVSLPESLTSIYLPNNRLTKMPPFPPNLQKMDISENLIFDKFPDSFSSSMTQLYANGNRIYGSIPNLPAVLMYLYLDNNQLNGTFPNLPNSIQSFQISFNKLTGSAPQTWPSSLTYLDISHNLLTGSLQNVDTTFASSLSFSWNLFTGNLPNFKQNSYTSVDLSNNLLTGDVDLGNISISNLYLNSNPFKKFPKSLPQNIVVLYMGNIQLGGNISSYLIPNTVHSLDLSSNYLTGQLPSWQNLNDLNVSNNLLTGSIPKSLGTVYNLDLSYNQLSGCVNYTFTGAIVILNDNFLSGNLTCTSPTVLNLQNNLLNDVTIRSGSPLLICDLSNNPMAPGVFGKTFKSICKINDIYSSNSTDCGIVPFIANYTRQLPIKTSNPTTIKLTTDSLKSTNTITNASQVADAPVDATQMTRNSISFRP
eukprot:NODE_427_length_7663_cov_0.258461.p1 type:complete len:593 gc:universal NODE_427_length_7663_cov_0.258461:419-2197(+)